MGTLDLWKHVKKLSVDEFMNLLFELEPGTVKFDYGNPDCWPKGAAVIYKLLTDDIRAEKLYVTIDDPHRDPRISEYFSETYGLAGNPWWADGEGKLFRGQLIKWLVKYEISSEHFGVEKTSLKDATQEGSTAPKEQASTHDTVSATTTASQPSPTESSLSLPSVRQRVSTEGQDNAQVRYTCRDNPEAVAYVEARQKQGAKPEEIAVELTKAGGGVAVIGCLLDPTKANVMSAREHGKYLLKKAKQ